MQATALVAKGQQPVEAMFRRDVMIASQSDLESQIEALLPGSDPDVHVKEGLTLFTQYVFFRLQYWYNKYPHRWPIANHECLQSIQARRSFTRKWMRSFSSLKEPEIDMRTVSTFKISASGAASLQHWTPRIFYLGACPAAKQVNIRGSHR